MAYLGNNLTVQQYAPQIAYFSGNGSTTAFTLPVPVVSAAQIIVVVANVIQNPSTAFSVSGTTLTFTSAPASGSNNIWVEYTSLQTNTVTVSPGSTINTPTLISPIITGSVPQITSYTSGSGTYTVPTNCRYLYIKMIGGGGGGGGSGNNGTAGTGGSGGNTTFGSLLTANGGGGAGIYSGAGGTTVINLGAAGQGFQGQAGSVGGLWATGSGANGIYVQSGIGASSPFGGGGSGAFGNGNPSAGQANTGAGGGGGAWNPNATNQYAGSGGAAGGYIEAYITTLTTSYSYAVGSGGTAGTAGTNGFAGAAGGSGVIIIVAFF